MFNETVLKEIDGIRAKYPDARSALLPSLYVAQREFGWLSPEAMTCVAKTLNLPEAMVRGTASFYAMFRHNPVGRNVIQLCTNVSCMILGSDRLLDLLKSRFDLEPGETTKDGRFSLVIMECIGACGTAPAMLVNTDFHDNLTEQNLEEIMGKYK
ncbi:MAG TPA: NADH-quinone oxidoreductase subunit NuoE [Nitrospirae bacterium]|nr:NADH-quinone oxidoreductase subunit E [bacterium BMS3Abin10]GBE37762.1 NADH-quinone oxidoreductase subunit E [bacterium BMS3Bbin08]HDH51380.1 NADH-quinone oxidoreductase subunit NuoE [Nitrospirota bacterium]HDK17501.1 NADH-quinone oxidoreductase subunit NuoE [Nitrospirota bacterium]HDK41310.1 NADH-quinone oxidoreductase subunit NuoE [Nitrospirota bacterium]